LKCSAIKNEARLLGGAVCASEMRIGKGKTAVVGGRLLLEVRGASTGR
jgi:hypothetical protein